VHDDLKDRDVSPNKTRTSSLTYGEAISSKGGIAKASFPLKTLHLFIFFVIMEKLGSMAP